MDFEDHIDFKKWWSKQNNITLRMAPPLEIAKAAYNRGQEDMREKCLSKAMEIRFSINDEQVPAELGKWVYVEEIKKL